MTWQRQAIEKTSRPQSRGMGTLAWRHRVSLVAGIVIALLLCVNDLRGNAPAIIQTGNAVAPSAPDSFFGHLFKVYMPRQACMYHESGLIWLHVICDSIIALAYYSIPIALICFVRRRRDLAFNWIFVCFAVFIMACGATHVMAVLAIWHPLYRVEGIVKLITAIASVGTAAVLWPLIPKAIALPSPTQLQAVNKELESFSYSVSHDLRAPLRSIDGFSQALLDDNKGKLSADSEDNLRRLRAASQKMSRLIDDLLNLARVAQTEVCREKVDLSRIARAIITELHDSAPQRSVEVVIAQGVSADADPRLVQIMLSNLFANAWKFTGKCDHARIEFGCSTNQRDTEYFIRDNGAGFDMAHSAKLFGAFQRMHGAAEFPGTGVGLATVQRIVQRHGGRVWAAAEVDAGATFYFTL